MNFRIVAVFSILLIDVGREAGAVPAGHVNTQTRLRNSVAAGDNFTCQLLGDGTVRCWGVNDSGQLGNGTSTTQLAPVAVSGLSGVVAISAGANHVCALLS